MSIKAFTKESLDSSSDNPTLLKINTDGNDHHLQNKVINIEPAKFISSFDLRGIWNYRELLYFLALRDIKIRYKQTLLGIAWVLLQPVITTIIFSTIFLRLGTNHNFEVPYPLFAFSGFAIWTFINSAIVNCSNSLVNHSSLVTKVYFPRLIIPLSAVIATLLDLAFGLASVVVVMFIYKVFPTWQSLLSLLLIIPILFLSLGVGIIAAALNVKYRDVKYILPFAIQLLFFISPVFYTLSMLPEQSVWLWKLNPITGILENFRALLFGLSLDWYSLVISAVVSFAVFISGVFVFHRMEDDFADVI